ncbi:hypothetical protein HYPSUDRAFT_64591 [Hypholoma sublateritium FD-334 SS-4]|uniref:Homeobox domain-containing protein n=1 Tax=Hypholoma sublateritium (strain FD-334 SS-4) TaxID=945553 RepID=A0A0D2LEE3_HYPSF|nr:hypothetical protein HYPSUDRAFT_64591 [Hypholoma sublateritium FD-334 SS-4]
MNSPPSPLHFLANVVSSMHSAHSSHSSARSPSPSSSRSSSSQLSPSFFRDVASLHVPRKISEMPRESHNRALKHSNHTLRSDSSFVPFICQKSGRRTRKTTDIHLKGRMQMKTRRKELLQKAIKIKSLDNSPVNERQLLVLRMVYDEITMYPCESWMVLIAIIINRAYKQVKNWFSNERQKNRVGESIPFETEDGDKVRLRTSALSACQDWSDTFFEEVVMIYNYRVQRNSQFGGPALRINDASPDHDQ